MFSSVTKLVNGDKTQGTSTKSVSQNKVTSIKINTVGTAEFK